MARRATGERTEFFKPRVFHLHPPDLLELLTCRHGLGVALPASAGHSAQDQEHDFFQSLMTTGWTPFFAPS
jgi:hypothetical protein